MNTTTGIIEERGLGLLITEFPIFFIHIPQKKAEVIAAFVRLESAMFVERCGRFVVGMMTEAARNPNIQKHNQNLQLKYD